MLKKPIRLLFLLMSLLVNSSFITLYLNIENEKVIFYFVARIHFGWGYWYLFDISVDAVVHFLGMMARSGSGFRTAVLITNPRPWVWLLYHESVWWFSGVFNVYLSVWYILNTVIFCGWPRMIQNFLLEFGYVSWNPLKALSHLFLLYTWVRH